VLPFAYAKTMGSSYIEIQVNTLYLLSKDTEKSVSIMVGLHIDNISYRNTEPLKNNNYAIQKLRTMI
jgi:hypothetical protein